MNEKSIAQLQQERDRLAALIERGQARINEQRDDLAALDRVVALLSRTPRKSREQTVPVSADELRGLEIEAAAILIAERSNNRLKSTPARKALIEAGLLEDTPRAGTKLYQTLYRSDRFEQTARGEYRLMPVHEDDTPDEDDSGTSEIPTRVPSVSAYNGNGNGVPVMR